MQKLPLIATLLAIIAVAAGVLVGIQSVKAERTASVQSIADYIKKNNLTPAAEYDESKLPQAEVVGSTAHDFGHIGYYETTRIKFEIKNKGGSDLRITPGQVSCSKCTAIIIPTENLPEGVRVAPATERALLVAPGATAFVYVAFTQKNKVYTPIVSESAQFHTNDPRQDLIEFRISGKITKAYRLTADRFNVADLTVGHGLESRIGVFGFSKEQPLKLDRIEFLTEAKDSEYTLKIEPKPPEEVQAEAGATSGYDIVLTAHQPPMGKISHALRLYVANAEPPTVDIPIVGNVVGKIKIIKVNSPNVNWSISENYLDWSTVDGKTGAEATLRILAKLKADDPLIQYKIKSIFPSDALQAELGESSRGENLQTVDLKIRIPPGSKPANYRSLMVDSKPAKIVIETNDPLTPQIVIGLRFGIE